MSEVAAIAPIKVAASFGTGVFYVAASMLSMNVMQAIGLALSQPIISSINVLLGTAISFLIGGVPQNMTIGRIVLACAFLVAAVFLTSLASRARRPARRDEASHGKGEVTPRILILTFFGALGGVFYSTGVAFSLKSTTQPVGLSVMPFLCLLISGAWIGAMIICGSLMTRKKPGNGEAGGKTLRDDYSRIGRTLFRQYSARFRYTSALGRGQLAARRHFRSCGLRFGGWLMVSSRTRHIKPISI